MEESKKVPAIRFKGFTDEWEEKKLADVVQITMGQSPNGSTYSDTPSDFILVQGNADLKDGWVTPRVWTTQITKTADAGDLIMSVRAPAGAMGKTAFNVVIGRGVAAIKGNEFIYQNLVKKDIDGFWNALSCGSTFESLNADNIKSAQIAIPGESEQIRMGSFLESLDNLISLHQRKHEQLLNIKRSMLEKMFPKDGADVPEIRFAGFTAPWKKLKFPEFVDFYSGLTYTPADVRDAGTLVLRSSNVNNGEIVNADNVYVASNVVNVSNVEEGDIIVVVRNGSRTLIGKHAQIKRPMTNTVIGAFMTGIRSNTPSFVNALLSTSRFDSEVAKNIGATINQITGYMFSKMEFYVPDIAEQEEIGTFFENLDNTISLHQQKLDQLQNIKKSCLDKMFV